MDNNRERLLKDHLSRLQRKQAELSEAVAKFGEIDTAAVEKQRESLLSELVLEVGRFDIKTGGDGAMFSMGSLKRIVNEISRLIEPVLMQQDLENIKKRLVAVEEELKTLPHEGS